VRHDLKLTPDGDRWSVSGAVDIERVRYPIVVAAAELLKAGVADRDDTLRVDWTGTPFTVRLASMIDYRPSEARRYAERPPWRERREAGE